MAKENWSKNQIIYLTGALFAQGFCLLHRPFRHKICGTYRVSAIVAVVIMNQNTSGSALSYQFNFDNTGLPGTEDIVGTIDMEWDSKFVSSGMSNSFGDIDPQETHLYVLNDCGQIMERYEYNITINSNGYGDPNYNSGLAGSCDCFNDPDISEWYERWPDYSPHRLAGQHNVKLGISEAGVVGEITCWPNPGTDFVVFSGHVYGSNGLIIIRDQLGRPIIEEKVGPGNFTSTVYLNGLPQGLYVYSLEVDGQVRKNKKFVIQ